MSRRGKGSIWPKLETQKTRVENGEPLLFPLALMCVCVLCSFHFEVVGVLFPFFFSFFFFLSFSFLTFPNLFSRFCSYPKGVYDDATNTGICPDRGKTPEYEKGSVFSFTEALFFGSSLSFSCVRAKQPPV